MAAKPDATSLPNGLNRKDAELVGTIVDLHKEYSRFRGVVVEAGVKLPDVPAEHRFFASDLTAAYGETRSDEDPTYLIWPRPLD